MTKAAKRRKQITAGETRTSADFPELVQAQDVLRAHMDDAKKWTDAYAKLGQQLRSYQAKQRGTGFNLSADVPTFEKDDTEHDLKAQQAEARKRRDDANRRVKAQNERVAGLRRDMLRGIAGDAREHWIEGYRKLVPVLVELGELSDEMFECLHEYEQRAGGGVAGVNVASTLPIIGLQDWRLSKHGSRINRFLSAIEEQLGIEAGIVRAYGGSIAFADGRTTIDRKAG